MTKTRSKAQVKVADFQIPFYKRARSDSKFDFCMEKLQQITKKSCKLSCDTCVLCDLFLAEAAGHVKKSGGAGF